MVLSLDETWTVSDCACSVSVSFYSRSLLFDRGCNPQPYMYLTVRQSTIPHTSEPCGVLGQRIVCSHIVA